MNKMEMFKTMKKHNEKEYTNTKAVEGLELVKKAREMGLDVVVSMQDGIIEFFQSWKNYVRFCYSCGLNKNDVRILKIYNELILGRKK